MSQLRNYGITELRNYGITGPVYFAEQGFLLDFLNFKSIVNLPLKGKRGSGMSIYKE
jgi:hypothetical protein